jgi:Protein kinase domain
MACYGRFGSRRFMGEWIVEPLRADDPRMVGSYRLLGRLGSGGMGRVFLGESPGGRKVAVKLMLPEHAPDAEFRQRFAREVAAARQVGGFHTAPVVDADPSGDPPWMVTAYIPGPSLDAAVRTDGPLDTAAVRNLGAALAEGLLAVHACGLVHRDLKPQNIIMAADGPRIIDFGIARLADATALTSSGVLIGTFSFMSPEQVIGTQVGPPSDVFSLGSVLAFAATGRGPFDAPTVAAVIHRIATDTADLAEIGDPLRGIIGACLTKDPAARPNLSDLLGLFTSSAVPASLDYTPTFVPPTSAADPSGPEPSAAVPVTMTAAAAPARQKAAVTAPAVMSSADVTASARPAARRSRAPLVLAAIVVIAGAGAGVLVALHGGTTHASTTGITRAAAVGDTCLVGTWQDGSGNTTVAWEGKQVTETSSGGDIDHIASNGVDEDVWGSGAKPLYGTFNGHTLKNVQQGTDTLIIHGSARTHLISVKTGKWSAGSENLFTYQGQTTKGYFAPPGETATYTYSCTATKLTWIEHGKVRDTEYRLSRVP